MRLGFNSLTLFVCCLALFSLHQYFQKIVNVNIPVIDNYLDPLLFMPILLMLLKWERQLIFKSSQKSFPLTDVISYFLIVSVVCEFLLPQWSDTMIGDPWDVVCYGVGSFIFVFINNKTPVLS